MGLFFGVLSEMDSKDSFGSLAARLATKKPLLCLSDCHGHVLGRHDLALALVC